MIPTMILLFVVGYLFIALEHKTRIDKSAVALLMAGAIWTVFSLLGNDPHIQHELVDQLGDTCEILVFLIGAMTIVDLIDSYGGFSVITDHVTTRNKRKLMWLLAIITFFMSAALDNMTNGLLTGAEANKITKEPFVIYLSGVDTRGELTENARSDVNILAAVNPVTKRVALINTPRDYYVDLAGTDSKDKLTHAGLYGVETSMATLGNLYGVNVDHYIRINFAGFISIIDALGGVDVYSDQAFTSVGSPGYYDPTTFVEGWNHLDGKAALAFARERHAFASGDIQRGINQMKVIDAMLNKIKSPALLMGFSKIMDAAADCFVTSFSQDQISALVRMQLSDFAEWDIESYTVTGTSSSSTKCYSAKGQKLYVMKPDDASVSKAKEMIASVLGGEGTVADTTQKPEKTEVFTPTTDPNAAVSEVPAESVPEEVPADSLPEETVPADQPADAEQPADTQPQEPAVPAEGETGSGDTAGEAPSISLPTQEEVEQAASSIYNAASSIWDAIQDAASQQNDAA